MCGSAQQCDRSQHSNTSNTKGVSWSSLGALFSLPQQDPVGGLLLLLFELVVEGKVAVAATNLAALSSREPDAPWHRYHWQPKGLPSPCVARRLASERPSRCAPGVGAQMLDGGGVAAASNAASIPLPPFC
ncbi:unnamed protein product [Polarella glacialis]|uniref:Uncharacterized protein n=1 Tax=Polarella glacialis TaxID=89957 RepID=A0A813HAN1_POLGL|nr:unnamed protein product [Polarella glacialis]